MEAYPDSTVVDDRKQYEMSAKPAFVDQRPQNEEKALNVARENCCFTVLRSCSFALLPTDHSKRQQ
jgi:hypothetical protein